MAITAVLLAAGYATRLYPLTKDQPKALLPLGQGAILDVVIDRLRDVAEIRRRILVTNHRFAGQFQQWQQRARADVRILDDGTATPESRLGAIRDVELARQASGGGEDLLVVGTDNLFRWSLQAFVVQAQRARPHPSIALWQAPSADTATQFGVVMREASGRLTRFVEKSPQPPSRDVSLCVYYFPAAMGPLFKRFFDEGGNPDAPGHFIEWLVRTGTVYGILMPGEWHDIGTPEEYESVKHTWSS